MQPMEQGMGARVALCDLTCDERLNGSHGRLKEWNAANRRWQVFLITGPDRGEQKAVKPLNLVPVVEEPLPLAIHGVDDVYASGFEAFAEDMLQQVGKIEGQDSITMDTWLELPGMDGTFVRFVGHDDQEGHLFYKFLHQHKATIEFHCLKWDQNVIRLDVTDVLVICGAEQAWPFCFMCKKFLLPPDGHRNSKAHQNMKQHIADHCPAYMRSWAALKKQNCPLYRLLH
jgi:hypothetical protein